MKYSILLCLALVGCTKPVIVREPYEVEIVRYESVYVPAPLLRPHDLAFGEIKSNADLERVTADLIIKLKACNADKAEIKGLE